MFCPFCASPEGEQPRRAGAPGNQFIAFICGNELEMDGSPHIPGAPAWLRGSGTSRPIACVVFGNQHPHNLARRLKALEEKHGSSH